MDSLLTYAQENSSASTGSSGFWYIIMAIGLWKMFEKAGKRISDLNKDIARIREAQGMTPEKKRERIDRIQLERNRLAERVLAQYDSMK